MSKKTVVFRKKIRQSSDRIEPRGSSHALTVIKVGHGDRERLIPRKRIISKGRTTQLVEINPRMAGEDAITIVFDGETKVYKRFPGHASGRVGTEPMNPGKADKLKNLK